MKNISVDSKALFSRDFDSEQLWRFAIARYPEQLHDPEEQSALKIGIAELDITIAALDVALVKMQECYFGSYLIEDFAGQRLNYQNQRNFFAMDFDRDKFIVDGGKQKYQQLIKQRDVWLDALLE